MSPYESDGLSVVVSEPWKMGIVAPEFSGALLSRAHIQTVRRAGAYIKEEARLM
jgi:hypothetical protein